MRATSREHAAVVEQAIVGDVPASRSGTLVVCLCSVEAGACHAACTRTSPAAPGPA